MIYIQEFAAIVGGGKEAYLESVRTRLAPHLEQTRGMRLAWLGSTIGSTASWPEAIVLWELRDWAHYAEVCERAHTDSSDDRDLRERWQEATRLRSRSRGQTLVSAPFSPSLDELRARKAHGTAFAFSSFRVRPGGMRELFARLESGATGPEGTLVGAYEVAFTNDRAYAIRMYPGLPELVSAAELGGRAPSPSEESSEHWGYASPGSPLWPPGGAPGAKVW